MIDMESKYGIPTVGVHVHVFARLVDSTVRTNGMPRARQAFVRAPMFNQPPAVLRGYIEGDDAVHGGPFMQRVFDLLTHPLEVENGFFKLSERPGLGSDLIETELREHPPGHYPGAR